MDPAERAKYVNSPEGPAFQKRRLLFGLHLARPAAARQGWIVVAEGYTDVLALAAAGVEAAVACMGTSLTAEQLRAAARAAPEVRLCFDADEAGQTAAWRTVEAAEGIPIRLSAAQLPKGQDPGDLAASPNDQTVLRRVVEAPKPLVACLIESRISRARSVSERDRALLDITDLLRRTPDSVEKDEGVRVATSGLGLSRAMEERLREASRDRRPQPLTEATRRQLSRDEELERRLLILALAVPEHAARYLAQVPPESLSSDEHRRAVALLAAGEDPERWPPELAALGVALRAEAAVTDGRRGRAARGRASGSSSPALERRAERLREDGDEAGRLRVLELIREARAAAGWGER